MSRLKQRQKTQALKAGKQAARKTAPLPSDAYAQGGNAFRTGKARVDNPYNVTNQFAWHEFWDTAWSVAQYLEKGDNL